MKMIVVSAAAAAALLITGCGSSGGGDSSTAVATSEMNLSGVAVDGYLSGATVFIDTDGDFIKDAGEYSTTTDESGSFSFTDVTLPQSGFTIIANGGVDMTTGSDYEGVVYRSIGEGDNRSGIVLSPLTTLVTAEQRSGSSLSSALNKIANSTGVASDMLDQNPIDLFNNGENKTALQASLVIESYLKAIKANASLSNATTDSNKAISGLLSNMSTQQLSSINNVQVDGKTLDTTAFASIYNEIATELDNINAILSNRSQFSNTIIAKPVTTDVIASYDSTYSAPSTASSAESSTSSATSTPSVSQSSGSVTSSESASETGSTTAASSASATSCGESSNKAPDAMFFYNLYELPLGDEQLFTPSYNAIPLTLYIDSCTDQKVRLTFNYASSGSYEVRLVLRDYDGNALNTLGTWWIERGNDHPSVVVNLKQGRSYFQLRTTSYEPVPLTVLGEVVEE